MSRRAKRSAPAWLRWAYLFLAFAGPLAAWADFQNYREYNALGIFSPEEWAEMMDGVYFSWAVQGMMAVCFLYLFFILTWDRDNTRNRRCLDEIFSTVILLAWAVLPLLLSIPDRAMALWVIVLIAFLIVAGRGWVKYFEKKRQEETTYE